MNPKDTSKYDYMTPYMKSLYEFNQSVIKNSKAIKKGFEL